MNDGMAKRQTVMEDGERVKGLKCFAKDALLKPDEAEHYATLAWSR